MARFEVQPAHKIYAFDRGWRIMRYVTNHLFQRTNEAAKWWFEQAQDVLLRSQSRGIFVKYWMRVYMVGLYMAGGVQYVSAMIIAALFLALQSIVLASWAALSLCLIGLLAVYTFIYARFYRIFFRCPNCHKEMAIPVFLCPTCQEQHTRLWPSVYGVLSHRCITCDTRLATLRVQLPKSKLLKRDELERRCPSCNHQMNAGIGRGTNVHIPVIGGPSTGKSNLIVMATKAFKETYEDLYHYGITFTDSKHKLDYTENIKRLARGRALLKTTEIVARAYNLEIQSPTASVPSLAYIYDAAGEAYNTSENTAQQEYYKYISGVLFVIDPFSIASYRREHESEIRFYQELIRPSELDVMQAYERMFTMFEDSTGLRKGRRFPHSIAIVVTKVDALHLENEIGTIAAHQMMNDDPSVTQEGDALNTLVRDFLCKYDLDHFVQNVEMQFSNVRYFSCSALGRMPVQGDMRAFVPMRVGEPLIWLLANAKAIDPPKLLDSGRATRVLGPITIPIRRK